MRFLVKVKGGPGSGHWGHGGRPGQRGGGRAGSSAQMASGTERRDTKLGKDKKNKLYMFVSAHDARLARMSGSVPEIPKDISSRDDPIVGLNGSNTEYYRSDGSWYNRNTASKFLPGWTRLDIVGNDQATISYAEGAR